MTRPAALAVLALALLVAPPAYSQSRHMSVYYIQWVAVGDGGSYGDVAYLELPGLDGVLGNADDANLLIDGGGDDNFYSPLQEFLDQKIGVGGTIDHMVLSHTHTDHYDGLAMVARRYRVFNYYENVRWGDGDGYLAMINDLEDEGTSFFSVTASNYLSGPLTNVGPGWDPYVSARVLCARKTGYMSDVNPWSLVIRIDCGGSSFLFGGDATSGGYGDEETEEWILNGTTPHSFSGAASALALTDIFKAHHHGSAGSNSTDFLDRMRPYYTVVPVGYDSDSGHPNEEALDRIWAANSIVYRNDLDGTVLIKCDDLGNYDIVRERAYVNESSTPGASGHLVSSPPAIPQNLRVTGHDHTSISLDWDDVAGASGYDIFRSETYNGDPGAGYHANPGSDATGIYSKVNDSNVTSSQYIDADLTPGRIYFYRVSSKKVHTSGGYSVCYERRYSNQAGAATSVVTPTPSPSPTATPAYLPLDSGDYNGDGTSDPGIFRPSSGLWSIAGITRLYLGGAGDQAVCGDYDGDGVAEIAIYRPSGGFWVISGLTRRYFGQSADLPVPGDYDGDGVCDLALFRPGSGLWAVADLTRVYLGGSGDYPVPGYYSGRAKLPAVYRAAAGLWSIRGLSRFYFGGSSDRPVPAGFQGRGEWSAAVFRPNSGLWAVYDLTRAYFGSAQDIPRPADCNGDGLDEISIFRAAYGLWSVRDVTRAYLGSTGDLPIAARVPWPVTPSPPPTRSPTPAPSATPSATPSPSPSSRPTLTPTATPSPSPRPTLTPSPTPLTPAPTPTPLTPAPTPTPVTPTPPPPVPTPSTGCDFQVSGVVSDQSTALPLASAEVTIEFSDGQTDVAFSVVSGAYGFVVYDTHPPGAVILEASLAGYQSNFAYAAWQCQTEITGLNIALMPEKTPTPAP
jgi:beta-lactamase superfamily II metal-dependent hydrolase